MKGYEEKAERVLGHRGTNDSLPLSGAYEGALSGTHTAWRRA